MRLKANLKLRKVGMNYMLVDVSDADANITDVYTLNETAAFVWNAAVEHGVEAKTLASLVCEEYDVSHDTVLSDIESLLLTWRSSGLIVD
ncbi:MAG: PqqD family protein [Duncaniella sp.]|nr:PqqD family protein [Duncaniella sp.]MDE5694211.1 PqqD family protein [Duncaniella sp.]